MKSKQIKEQILELTKQYYQEKFGQPEDFIPGETAVRYAGRVFDEKELMHLVESSLEFWLTAGHNAEEFENEFADYFGVEDSILVNSGSSANLIAMSTLTSPKLGERRLKPGDEVITVAAGFPTTIAPIIQNNLVPVFIDVDIPTYNIITEQIEEAITPKTKAIFIAHTLGNPFNLEAIMKIKEKYNLWLIEDNCDALGSRYNGKLTGTFGDLATVSFYPAHHMTMGEGGSVLTNSEELARIARSFRDWGRDCYCASGEDNTCGKRFTGQYGDLPVGYDHKFVYSHIGYNLKVTDMQAAIGLEQLKKLPDFIEARKDNYKKLRKGLEEMQDCFILPEATENSDPSWFSFILTVKEDAPFTRTELVSHLNDKKIHTRNLFAGNILRQPAFLDKKYKQIGDMKNTDFIMNNTCFLGVYPGNTDEQINYVFKTIKEFVDGRTQKN